MQKIVFNDPTKQVKVGNKNGEKLPPGKFLLEFRKASADYSKNEGAGTAGDLQAVYEFTVLKILGGGAPFDVDFGPGGKHHLTAFEGAGRSNVLKLKKEPARADHNELAGYLHNVDMSDGALVRELYGSDNTQMAESFNNAIERCMAPENPLMGMRLVCDVKHIVTKQGHQFLPNKYSLPEDEASIEINEKIIASLKA